MTAYTPTTFLTTSGRLRAGGAAVLAAAVVAAAWLYPAPTRLVTPEPGYLPSATAAANQGWWGVIVAVTVAAILACAAVAVSALSGREWTRTAVRAAVVLTLVLGAVWLVWGSALSGAAGYFGAGVL